MNCPNCSAPMDRVAVDGVYGPPIELDLCFACHALWIDRRESLHLTPRGTIDLFQRLHEHEDDPRHALGGRMTCPHCRRRLSLHNDIGKAGRFSYYACPAGEGRLTPFSEFLKEKQFVRQLTPLEQERLKADVKSVQCSGCGAPVDLGGGFQCAHCGSPITVLDADAVRRTLLELEEADARRSGMMAGPGGEQRPVDPAERALRSRALASMEAMRSSPDDPVSVFASLRSGSGLDLLSASIAFIFGKR